MTNTNYSRNEPTNGSKNNEWLELAIIEQNRWLEEEERREKQAGYVQYGLDLTNAALALEVAIAARRSFTMISFDAQGEIEYRMRVN